LTFRLMKHFRRAMEGKGYVIHKQGEVCPDDPTIEQYVDEVERVLQPRGRCIECGGGEGYWRHKYADDARGYHLFTPETPHARMVREALIRERPVHPSHSTSPIGGLGIDLTLPCRCDDPTKCPCRCHAQKESER
jgi:hypothetical protein